MIKISSGKYKGHILFSPKHNRNIRPSFSKLKMALFNIIDVKDKIFLDLFSGIGTIGIEALSRGAKYVEFVDKDYTAVNFLYRNISKLKMPRSLYRIYKSDVFSYLKKRELIDFDYIFLDPPYNISISYLENIFSLFFKKNLKKTCIIILQFDLKKEDKLDFKLKKYIFKYKKYADSVLVFWSII